MGEREERVRGVRVGEREERVRGGEGERVGGEERVNIREV